MSRRLMLATGGPALVIPDPLPGDGGGGDPDPEGWPATADAALLALRPTGARSLATATGVDGDNVGTLLQELADLIDPQVGTSYGTEGPDHSCVLFLPPGEYVGGFGTGKWTSIVGTSGNPEDVIIFSDTAAADGVIHPFAPLYVEGVTLKAGTSATESPKYCAHIGGSPRTTFANVRFDATDATPAKGNAGTVGMDGSAGATLTFYGCTFLPPAGSGIGMNLHGGATGIEQSRVSFIDCTAVRGLGYAGVTSTEGERDELYVIGGNIGGDILTDSNVSVFTDLANTVTGSGSTARDHTDWPIPTDNDFGLAGPWGAYFAPSAIAATGTTYARAVVSDTAPMTPVTNRIYYCPVPITEAMLVNKVGVWTRTGSGSQYKINATRAPITATYYPSDGLPAVGFFPGTTPLPSGQGLESPVYPYVLHPAVPFGGNRMWVAVQFTTGAPTIDGSAMLPGLHDCYYSDDGGTTIVQATAGTPFPLAHAAQVR